MTELSFDIRLDLPDFTLEIADSIPLDGITALTGPSGSGKTSLLRVLAGLETRGTASVRFGDDVWDGLAPHRRGIGYVFQDARLFDHLDVAGNLAYGAARNGVDKAHVDEVAAALRLEPLLSRRPATLSGGEQRRVALGRAMAARPRILFLDEPLSGLDPDRKSEMLDAVCRACKRFATPAIFVSHDRDEVNALARRELRLLAGRKLRWAEMPPRLSVDVLSREGNMAMLSVGGQELHVPLAHAGTESARITLPRGSYLLSRNNPGDSNGLITIEVVGAQALPDGRLGVSIDGQDIVLTPPPGDPRLYAVGGRLFLTLLSVSVLNDFEER